MDINAILVHPQDNVAVAIKALKAGEPIIGVAGDALKAGQDGSSQNSAHAPAPLRQFPNPSGKVFRQKPRIKTEPTRNLPTRKPVDQRNE